MPTTRPRYQVTETDEIARALDAAELRWPGESRSRLLVRLVLEGGDSAAAAGTQEIDRRRAAIRRYAGTFPGLSDPAYREALRDEWPE